MRADSGLKQANIGLAEPLLGPADPDPVAIDNAAGPARFVLIADHAGEAMPARLGDMGLSVADRARHIALDIGIAGVATRLAALLDAPAIRQTYSRLVIDCNRPPLSPRAIVEESDGSRVPANVGLTDAERTARIAEVHQPYQDTIAAAMAARPAPVLVALHSFTPAMNGHQRPWHSGILHLHDSPLSDVMLALLRAEGDLIVGDNEPYAMHGTDYTVPHHAIARGLPYVEIEIRQDLISDAAGQQAWAERLARLLPQALAISEAEVVSVKP